MPLPRVSLRSFLSTAKKALQNAEHTSPSYTVVIGNESADLDSLCSAVVFAYLRTYAVKSKMFYIPLSNLQARDLALRPELLPVLGYAGLGMGDLLTLGDLRGTRRGEGMEKEGKIGNKEEEREGEREGEVEEGKRATDASSWVLVDHNRMTGELGEAYAANVVGCVDHHVDEGAVPSRDVCEGRGEPRIVEKSGSCASLVVGYCRDAWDELAAQDKEGKGDKGEAERWNRELARLALAPVLIDTQNLGDESKTTEADRQAVGYLERWMGGGDGGGYSSKAYFDEITTAKGDIGGLGIDDILRKDYKLWVEGSGSDMFKLGISSVVKSISWLKDHADGEGEKGFVASMEAYRASRALDLFAVMTTWNDATGKFRRDLFVLAKGEKGVSAAKAFEKQAGEGLGLRKWREGDGKGGGLDRVDVSAAAAAAAGDSGNGNGNGDCDGEEHVWMRCWRQENVGSSRKQVAPLMRQAIAR